MPSRSRLLLVALLECTAQSATACGCSESARRVVPDRRDEALVATSAPPPSPLDLDALPPGVVAVWPATPRTTRTIDTSDVAALAEALGVAGTRVVFRGRSSESFVIAASDTDLELSSDAEVGELRVERGTHRVRIRGGRARRIVLAEPATYHPDLVTNPAWFVEDVLVDGVTIEHPEGGIELRGRRAAVIRCRTRVHEYSIWSGGAYGEARSEDLIVAGNHFESDGVEATVRFHDVTSVIVVGNVLVNGTAEMEISKHNLRFHGHVDRAYAAHNVFVHSGVMTALDQPPPLPPDRIERVWLVDNVFHQRRPSLLELRPERLPHLVLTGNVVHSDQHPCLWCGPVPEGWVVADNTSLPYAPAPPNVSPTVLLGRSAAR